MSTRSTISRNSIHRSADFDTRSLNSTTSDQILTRNRTRFGTFTNGKPAFQKYPHSSVKEIRINNFREVLRKLVQKNDRIFGKNKD